ncbi:hypothetical protein [Sinorhizobium meliloti]|uniref:hypothetical protein n=1 Tax=Rhizobium meliloti TaxID=382 RepID=UPI0019176BD0|nr:hypothetical protein [Sinorhizobium meliloti]
MALSAATVFRDYEVDGVPASGPHKVKKSEVRAIHAGIDAIINAFTANGGLIFSSKATLDASLAYAANSSAWVIGDATAANNGVYGKVGASGTGSWTRRADLPFSFIIASDVGAGTPNAIQATTSIPVSGSALIWTNVFEANTASPVTVSFNGGSALTIKTNAGNDVAAGGLTAGMIVMGIVSGSTFRLVSDQASSAIIAQAEAAQTAAAASAAAAAASAAAAEGVGVPVAVWPSGTLRTMKVRATDTYCILDAPGAADPAGVNDSTSAFEAMVAGGVKCEITAGSFVLTRKLVIPDGVELIGQGRGYEFAHKTKLLFAGTGTKEHAVAGATATVVANPDAGAPYLADSGTRGNNYSTLDLTTNFSAAIILGKASGLKSLGIYPNFNGVTGYAGTTGGLSDEWDVGVWARNSDWWQIEDCNVSGHWRKSGLLVTAHNIGDGKVPSNEIGHAIRSHFQGFRGITIRSPETVVGNNWGFAGTDFVNCLVRGLWHQSRHLATSSFLTTPFASPSGALEISGDTMRGIQFLNSTFIGRDDINMIFGKCSEIQFDGCYEESKEINVGGVALPNSTGSRIVATTDSVDVTFQGNSSYGVDFSPNQTRDSSLTGQRYPSSSGVFSPSTSTDDDYMVRRFGSYIGHRFRKSTDRYIFEDEMGGSQVIVDASGRVQANLLFAGTVTIADDAAASIPTPKNGGLCVITCCGTTENGNFPDPLRSGAVFYDAGTAAFSATKQFGGANFVAVNTDVSGVTGTDLNVTIGVIAGNLRVENRSGASAVFRYAFMA